MTTEIPIETIIALVITFLIAVVAYAVIAPIFTGPEVTAWKTLGDEINIICNSEVGTARQVTVYLPDSKGNTPLNLVFLYLAVNQDNFILARRTYGVEKSDIVQQFADWVRNRPGNKVLRERTLNNCLNNKVQICGQFGDPPLRFCNNFQFESEEGKESLGFTITKLPANTVLLSYTRAIVCGDGRCCEPENATTCPPDCENNKPCKLYTEG